MGDGSHVLDQGDFQAGSLQRTDSGLTASAGALDVNFNSLHAMLDCNLGCGLSSRLSCKRGALTAAAEVQGARGAPGHCIALQVGDGDDGIVEGRLDMSLTSSNVLALFPLHITFAQAALGGDVKISTVDGDVLYTVKPGTQTDTKIRLKGKGVPSLRNSNVRGDHYVTLVVQTPTKLNEKAKEALRAFDEACGNRQVPEAKAADGENTAEQPKKKKGFMDKVKEAFEDIDK